MKFDINSLSMLINEDDYLDIFRRSKVGFERESLRINNDSISHEEHPKSLGSALCNRFITTDFSEAQLELITSPIEGASPALEALDNIHHFVSLNLKDEILWPFSMPPNFHSFSDLPIAKFGISNEGKFRHIYRKGLANRYGKSMQAISGLHYNYSLSDSFFEKFNFSDEKELNEIRSNIYFNILRNVYQMNWLLIYLFGASPIIDESLITNKNESFKKCGKNSFYLPHATSLRMSEYGYSNIERRAVSISINSLDEYISDLNSATNTLEPKYKKFQTIKDSQLNSSILQIEAEYYAIARAKSMNTSSTRASKNLYRGGVDFLEIRSLDLDPFSRTGITLDTLLFLDLFMVFCLLKESRIIDKEEIKRINHNDLSVSKYGRDTSTPLFDKGESIDMLSLGIRTLEQMLPIAEVLDLKDTSYQDNLKKMISRLKNPEETISARIFDEMSNKNISHNDLGISLAEEYFRGYNSMHESLNPMWDILKEETISSISRQKILEQKTISSGQSFEEFKSSYYSS